MRFVMFNWRDPRHPKAGGAERVTLGYLAALAKRGHDVFWYANDFAGAAQQETIDGVTIVRGGAIGSSWVKARKWYRQQPRFDLVIDQHHGIPWYAPWWCRTHCIAYIHEVLGPIWNTFFPWPVNAIGRGQERWTQWAYRDVPFWTACQSTKDQLHRHGVRNITLIPYGVSTVALPELDAKTPGAPLRLIVVSRLAPNKRIDHAIRALHHLKARGIQAHLTIVGVGEEDAKLRSLVSQTDLSNCVTFTGGLTEPAKDERLRQAHVLLHTSMREGWGLNVIEANAMGTPAVVYPVPGLVESTIHEQTGLVSAAETPQSLADSIQRLLNRPDDYRQFRQKAWERSQTFHWSRVLPRACEWLETQARGETPVPTGPAHGP